MSSCIRCLPWYLGFALFVGCERHETAPAKAAAPTRVVVTVAAVERVLMDRTLPVVGTLFAKDEATVAAQVQGVVQKTAVEFGDRVKEGQEIAEIDTETYAALAHQAQAELAKSRASLLNAEHELKRQLELERSGVASPADMDGVRTAAETARGTVAAAEATQRVASLNLEHSHVRAPFDGAVADRIASRGDFMSPGKPMFRIVNDAVLKYIVQAPEAYAGQVVRDQEVVFTVDAFPGSTFSGRVFLISPQINTGTRAFAFGALVPNAERKLKANSFARGELILERSVSQLVVPMDAILTLSGVSRVFVVERDAVKSVTVRLGRQSGARQVILDGLSAGQQVVTSGQSRLAEGRSVEIRIATNAPIVTDSRAQ